MKDEINKRIAAAKDGELSIPVKYINKDTKDYLENKGYKVIIENEYVIISWKELLHNNEKEIEMVNEL